MSVSLPNISSTYLNNINIINAINSSNNCAPDASNGIHFCVSRFF